MLVRTTTVEVVVVVFESATMQGREDSKTRSGGNCMVTYSNVKKNANVHSHFCRYNFVSSNVHVDFSQIKSNGFVVGFKIQIA